MKFELKPDNRNVSDEELLYDLKRVAKSLNKESISQQEYRKKGSRFHNITISRRFKGWNNALEKAGLVISLRQNVPEKELFENIEKVWIGIGRQPGTKDMVKPLSEFTQKPYRTKYGSWRKALEAFVEYMNKDVEEPQTIEYLQEPVQEKEIIFKHKTKREPSSRLRVQVLMKDGNKCRLCGITVTGDNIHFDHIKPWSKGGETVLENLQVLCAEHNLAKGNLEY
jgi:predicted restriction endonuclease